jgi:DNA-binding NarL/FixJ family response regulator
MLRPDIILMRTDSTESLETLRTVLGRVPTTKVVALGVSEAEDEIIECAEAGIAGYLPRNGSLEDLVVLIQSVARGEAQCSPRIAATLLRRVATLAGERRSTAALGRLTPREHEIVGLIDQSLSNKEIAQRLSIEVRTVKNHVHNILEKLQVHRRNQAAAQLRAVLLTAHAVGTHP